MPPPGGYFPSSVCDPVLAVVAWATCWAGVSQSTTPPAGPSANTRSVCTKHQPVTASTKTSTNFRMRQLSPGFTEQLLLLLLLLHPTQPPLSVVFWSLYKQQY